MSEPAADAAGATSLPAACAGRPPRHPYRWAVLLPLSLYAILSAALTLLLTESLQRAGFVLGAALGLTLVVSALALRADRLLQQDHVRIAAALDPRGPSKLSVDALHSGAARRLHLQLQRIANEELHALAQAERMRAQVDEAQKLRLDFVASMGHDLRGPLNSMLGFAELLLVDGDAVAEGQRASVTTIRQRTLDLLTLLDEMLDWARLSAGRLSLAPQRFTPVELLREVTQLVEQRLSGRPLRVRAGIFGEPPAVCVDGRRIAHAVVAVLGDAIRSARSNEVSLHVQEYSRGGLLLTVSDPQLLIREQDQARFFEAFRPSYAPSGKRIAGLGLGPACAKAVFRAHGGDVSFVSEAQNGTVFEMWLPAAEAATQAHATVVTAATSG